MGVDLSRGYIRVAKQRLYAPEIRTTFDQMRCKCVPHHVRRQTLRINAGAAGKQLH
jgi:hypothetical protein